MTARLAEHIWLLFFVVHFCMRLVPRLHASRDPIRLSDRDALQTVLLVLARLAMAGLPLIYVATGFPQAADYPFYAVQGYLGAALALVVLWIFYLTHRDLGRNWSHSLDLREHHRLVTTGIYAYVRHPMYSGFWLMAIVQLLLLPNWIVGPAGLLSFGILFLIRVPREEELMIAGFGEEYRAYMRRTARIIPGIY